MADHATTERLDLPGNARALLDAVLAISSDLDLHSVLNRRGTARSGCWAAPVGCRTSSPTG
jgi:hypothetical protein